VLKILKISRILIWAFIPSFSLLIAAILSIWWAHRKKPSYHLLFSLRMECVMLFIAWMLLSFQFGNTLYQHRENYSLLIKKYREGTLEVRKPAVEPVKKVL
jgi:hypothetical protein